MPLWAALVIVGIHSAQCLVEVRPFNVNPSALSNLELLIPLMVHEPEHAVTEQEDVTEESREVGERPARDHDEPYSAIPAYAFTLDPFHAQPNTVPNPNFVQSRSFYLDGLSPRTHDVTDTQRNKIRSAKERGCEALARQHSGEARELLLYLCSELVDALASRCDCCMEQRYERGDKVPSVGSSMPWSGLVGGRREYMSVGDDHDPSHQQRVFV